MKKVDAWMLAGFLGLLGAGCGAPANDSEPAGIGAEQRIKTTVVKLNPSGQHEISTYYATPEQIELEEQQLVDAKRREEEAQELAVIVPDPYQTILSFDCNYPVEWIAINGWDALP